MKPTRQTGIGTTLVAAAVGSAAGFAGTAQAVEFEQQIQARYQPTYFENFDFNDNVRDSQTVTSAGSVDVGDEHVRGELRWGATVTGERSTGKILLESDARQDGGQADGDAVNVERAYFTYEFSPALVLQAGHEFKVPDFAAGGLLYGDDHPIFGVKGDTDFGSYDTYAIIINETDADPRAQLDSTVWFGKLDFDLGAAGTVSPIVAWHNNKQVDAQVTYLGATYLGGTGDLSIKGEAFSVTGSYESGTSSAINFRSGVAAPAGAASLAGDDISAFGANLTLEWALSDAFKPNIGFRWTSGDGDPFDNDVEGWLGITDISGFVAPMSTGMGVPRWGPNQNPAFSTPVVFGSTFETSGPATGGAPTDGSAFGGIGNSGTGLNPGQIVIAPGVSGSWTPRLSYMASLWFIWYEDTAGLEALSGAKASVDDFAGTNFEFRVDYAASENVTFSGGLGLVTPGDGVKDATGADDEAAVAMAQLLWSY